MTKVTEVTKATEMGGATNARTVRCFGLALACVTRVTFVTIEVTL